MNALERRKITVIGPSDVGKTTLIYRMCYDAFEEHLKPTLGASYSEKVIQAVDEEEYVLQFWDTAGMERYATLTPVYYPNTYIFWMVFDLTNRDSLRKLQLISLILFQRVKETPRIYLIGNKKDLVEGIKWKGEIEQFMATLPLVEYFEVSAKSGENVKLLEYQLQKDCPQQIPNPVTMVLNEPSEHSEEKKKRCC